MRRHRLLFAACGSGIALATLGACNAITGAHDRFVEEPQSEDSGNRKDTGVEPLKDAGATDSGPGQSDSGPKITTIEIPINPTSQWSSPNKATAGYDAGAVITSFNPPHDNHPMIVPMPLPDIPSDKYTVRARIKAHERAEYGIFVRGRVVAAGFSAFVLSSRYSSGAALNEPFLAPLLTARTDNTNDDPPSAGVANGPGYAFDVDKVWVFAFEVDGEKLHGIISREDDASIKSDMTLTDTTAPADRGKSFGFYGFGAPPASLLQLQLIY